MKDRLKFEKIGFDNTTNTSVKLKQQKLSTPFVEEISRPFENYQR